MGSYVMNVCSLILCLFILSCQRPKSNFSTPPNYDLNHPEKFAMPGSLLEISGIAFHQGSSDSVYSIQDEEGKVFKQKWGVKKQTNTHFGKSGDFEDLTFLGDTVVVLKSNGTIYSFPFTELNKKKTEKVREAKKILPKGEYEGLFGDQTTKELYVACKKCEEDKKKDVSIYVLGFSAGTDSLIISRTLNLDTRPLKSLGVKVEKRLQLSAIARHPQTREWYLLSHINKLLIVADANLSITAAFKLDPSLFVQPEGIAFDRDLNLFISNEGDEFNNGNVLKFKYIE